MSKKRKKPDTIRVNFCVTIGINDSTAKVEMEFDRKKWESYEEDEKDILAEHYANRYISAYFEEVEEE